MGLRKRLNEIHERLIAGSRLASRDLYLAALEPLRGFLATSFPSLSDDDLADIATDAITGYLANPERCDTKLSSLWSYICRTAKADAIDLVRKRSRRQELLDQKIETDVEFWASRTKDVFRGEDVIDARQIMKLYGHRLVTNAVDAKLLALILNGEDATSAYAAALGLPPESEGIEKTVKQAKDRMLLRLKRLRDEL